MKPALPSAPADPRAVVADSFAAVFHALSLILHTVATVLAVLAALLKPRTGSLVAMFLKPLASVL